MLDVRAIAAPLPGSSVNYDTSKGIFAPTRELMLKRKHVDDLLKDRVVERLLAEALRGAAEITAWKAQRFGNLGGDLGVAVMAPLGEGRRGRGERPAPQRPTMNVGSAACEERKKIPSADNTQ